MKICEINPRDEGALVAVRRAARQIGEALQLSTQDQTRLAAAASEVVREARDQSAGPIRFMVIERRLELRVPGLKLREARVARLLDDVVDSPEGARLIKHLVDRELPRQRLEDLRVELLTADPRAAAEEIRQQNAELLRALEEQRAAEDALRRSEERLQLAVTATRLGTWEVTNDDWSCSDRCLEIVGATGGAGAHPLTLISPKARQALEQGVRELRESGAAMELELEVSPDTWVVFRAVLEPDGVVVGTALDVSERRRREEEAHLRAELEELLVGVVSHDLRSPLGTLKMGLHMLRDAALSEDERFVHARMESALRTANQLVHDLLDFTKARLGGGIPVQPERHDAHWLVGEVLEELRLAHPSRDIVHNRSGKGAVKLDAERVKQVVTNLVVNALANSPKDSPVTVSTESDDAKLTMTVMNTGDPIPEELLPEIFNPLRQGSGGTRGKLGLGLFIVRHVAEAHGGTVEVTSDRESGTRFSLQLPL